IALLIAAMMDDSATVAQRNDACYALRGQRSVEVVSALRGGLADKAVRACAARDLREAGAVDALVAGLAGGDADAQMAAAHELGELRDPRALEPLGRAALSDNVLVASSAIAALGAYEPEAALPHLLRAAGQSGVSGIAALEQAARRHHPAVLALARRLLEKGDVAAQVIALAIIADLGGVGDLPKLRELAAHSDPVYSRGRGFGFMPPIDVARAAQTAIDKIAR
ncbi:MAG: HEAT repeat domain-containing protein, partial [Candidatus Solibacter sp.]|nr:HEAT repeat domain-containing protein [Candidatus Solibacter sp.]